MILRRTIRREELLAGHQHCVKSVQTMSFSWSIFSGIRTEYREIRSISPYSVRMPENMDQKKLRIWTLFTQCRLGEVIQKSNKFHMIVTVMTLKSIKLAIYRCSNLWTELVSILFFLYKLAWLFSEKKEKCICRFFCSLNLTEALLVMSDFFLLLHLVWIIKVTKFGSFFRSCILKKREKNLHYHQAFSCFLRNAIKMVRWQLEKSGCGDFRAILH